MLSVTVGTRERAACMLVSLQGTTLCVGKPRLEHALWGQSKRIDAQNKTSKYLEKVPCISNQDLKPPWPPELVG